MRFLWTIITLIFFNQSIYAYAISYEFKGVITQVSADLNSNLVSQIQPGSSTFTGVFCHKAPDSPVDSGIGWYTTYVNSSLSVLIDHTYLFKAMDWGPVVFTIGNYDNFDYFQMLCEDPYLQGPDSIRGIDNYQMAIAFTDNSGTAFSDITLPGSLKLSDFNSAKFFLGQASGPWTTGIITSLTPIPEPSTMMSFGFGIIFIIGVRRRIIS